MTSCPCTLTADNTTTILGETSEPQPDGVLIIEPAAGGQTGLSEDDYTTGPPELIVEGRCLTGVDPRSKWAPEFVAIDEQPYDEIMPGFRLREAQRPTDSPVDAGPAMDVCALDFLGVLLPHLRLLGREMPLVGSPAVGVKPRDAQRRQPLLKLQEDVVLAPSEHLRHDLA